MAADDRSREGAFRPDLEGLRGVAILLVLAFHVGLPGITGGFVGVDVFFVLSGFLITGLLIRERERTGRISLPTFYARRARRILPAALVVIVATLALAPVFLAPLDLPRVAVDGIASALSAGNLRFAATSMDYFAPNVGPSPFLHYWSLGVEEQFYLVWPTLVILAARGRRPRTAATIVMVGVVVASFAASLYLTDVSAPWAFYSLPTRAWQLALGGLLALLVDRSARISRPLVAVLGWLGLVAIVASAFVLDSSVPFPGTAALLPTVGAAAVILGGSVRGSPAALLVLPPMRFLGRISYSLYLVHWPIVVYASTNLAPDQTLTPEMGLGLAALSIAVAAVSQRFVEEPIHRGRRLALPPVRTLGLAGAAIVVTILVAGGIDLYGNQEIDQYASVGATTAGPSPAAAGDASPDLLATPAPSLAPQTTAPGGSPTAAATPVLTPSAAPATPTPTPPGPQPLPPDVRPSLSAAHNDWERLLDDGCLAQELRVQPPSCVYGNPNGQLTVTLVGDSHASQWFPALERIANARGWRLIPFVKLSCRFVDMPIYSRVLKREYTECEAWRKIVVGRLQALHPALTVVAAAGSMQPMNPADADPRRQGLAMARLLDQVPGEIAVLVDTPGAPFDVPTCLSRHVSDIRACAVPRSQAFGPQHMVLEKAAVSASSATLVDMSNAICPADPCPAVVNGVIVLRDGFHLTATFSRALAGPLLSALPPIGDAAGATTAPSASPTSPSGPSGDGLPASDLVLAAPPGGTWRPTRPV